MSAVEQMCNDLVSQRLWHVHPETFLTGAFQQADDFVIRHLGEVIVELPYAIEFVRNIDTEKVIDEFLHSIYGPLRGHRYSDYDSRWFLPLDHFDSDHHRIACSNAIIHDDHGLALNSWHRSVP